MNFWDFFWLLVWSFFFVAYLMILFHIFGDLFRDHMSGWLKALWVLFLIIAPFLGALIYLIARGHGMAERQAAAMRQMQNDADA
ncbi:MAG TPA: PLDc N-terminal domain-containing protein, partial [Candidatus Limnocylindria bacterium]|nr:PLDc N-terminal domain-containing protein [Candidatus Limnocylindria bacterium]